MSDSVTRFRRLRRPALVGAAAMLVAGGLAGCGGAASTAEQHRATTSPGAPSAVRQPSLHRVSANGHKLAFYVTPGHEPTIVLDSGGGMGASEWKKVAPELAARTGSTIITYDRSGVGKSSDVPGPWRARNAASDLAAGLRKLDVSKNVILVSHSLAGEIATYFVRSHPHRVAGAVLVDANLPQFFTPGETARIVAQKQKQIAALKQKPSTRKTRQILAVSDGYGPVHQAYHKLAWPQDVPAVALVSSQTPFPTQQDAQLWRKAQQEFVNAAPNRHLIVAERSSHDIPADRPDVIIHAVEKMVNQAH